MASKFITIMLCSISASLFITSPFYADKDSASKHIAKSYNYVVEDPYLASRFLIKAIEEAPEWDYPHILLGYLYEINYSIGLAISEY